MDLLSNVNNWLKFFSPGLCLVPLGRGMGIENQIGFSR